MDESKILLNTNKNKIIQYVLLVLMLSYTIVKFFDSIPPIWFIFGIIILFYGFFEFNLTTSTLVYLDIDNLVIQYKIFRQRSIRFKKVEIEQILFHRSRGRLDRNSLLLTFKENSKKKYIYFAGNDKDCDNLVEGLKNAGIMVYNE